jgi:RimJ/RimL family protein N-acetyltransferase
MAWDLQPTLTGELVSLVPLSVRHRDALLAVARPSEIWDYWTVVVGADEDAFDAWLVSALGDPWAFHLSMVWRATGELIGSTSFLPREDDRNMEIGWTWITPRFWGTGANTEAKFLQLEYAFETLKCIRVMWDTYADNGRSRAALERLGAKLDGLQRNYNIRRADGTIHDSAFYSMIDSEWPAVKERLRRG